jgi:hypothetical protein
MKTLLATILIALGVIVCTSAVLIISRRKLWGGCHELSCMCHKRIGPACPPRGKPVLHEMDSDQ